MASEEKTQSPKVSSVASGSASMMEAGVAKKMDRVEFTVTKDLERSDHRFETKDSLSVLQARVGCGGSSRSRYGRFGGGSNKEKAAIDGIWDEKAQLCTGIENGWIAAALYAWDGHHSLSLRADHLWILLMQGVAKHVENNAEKLRKKFVMHEGTKHLSVSADDFTKGGKLNDWGRLVHDFGSQIIKNTTKEAGEIMFSEYTTTDAVTSIATKITIMDAMKSFFSYGMSTCCGFPSVALEGSLEDWVNLRKNAIRLVDELCLPELSEKWKPALLSCMDRFIASYKVAAEGGKIDDSLALFWNSMIKRGATYGSGARSWFNGWFNVFFPYLKRGAQNGYCVPYSESLGYVKATIYKMVGPEAVPKDCFRGGYGRSGVNCLFDGPGTSIFPDSVSSAPVEWDYNGITFPMKFQSGFLGFKQDKDGMLQANVGWWVLDTTPDVKIDENVDIEAIRKDSAQRNALNVGETIMWLDKDAYPEAYVKKEILKVSRSELCIKGHYGRELWIPRASESICIDPEAAAKKMESIKRNALSELDFVAVKVNNVWEYTAVKSCTPKTITTKSYPEIPIPRHSELLRVPTHKEVMDALRKKQAEGDNDWKTRTDFG